MATPRVTHGDERKPGAKGGKNQDTQKPGGVVVGVITGKKDEFPG